MKRFKKLLLGLVALAAMAVLCAVCAGAETYGDYYYSVLDDGTVEITGYNGSATELEIPAEIDGKSVTSIGNRAFKDCTSLTSVTIPDGVKCIGHSAFYECTSLKSITIPDSVTEITGSDGSVRTDGAFGMCTSLESVKLSENLERIDSGTFNGCTALKNITIPGSVKSIGAYAFNGTAIINNQTGVFKYVDKWLIYAFGDFNENGDGTYIDVVIPSDTIGIAENALGIANYYINNLTIPTNVTSVGDIIEKYTYDDFNQSYYINNLIFENGVTNIESCAFNRNSQIKNIVLPKSLESIGSSAFNDCKSLQNIEINGCTIIGQSAFSGCTELKEIILPNCTKVIENNAFSRCSSLKSVTLSNSVTSIGDSAFADCSSLTSITIPDSVTSIGDFTFHECSSLTSITIPDSVTSIGIGAFTETALLNNQTTPVKYADTWVIAYDSDAESVVIKDGTKGIANSAFSYCGTIKSITIPNSVISIGNLAFSSCTSLTSIIIPKSVTSIGSCAFYDCTSLTAIDVAEGNRNYSSADGILFNKNKTELICYPSKKTDKSYTVPDSVTLINEYAFYRCSSLKSLELSKNLTVIEYCAFQFCDGLERITIPNGVTSIENRAFYHCSSLKRVELPDSLTSISDWAFSNCSSLTSVKVPDSVTIIYWDAFSNCTCLESIIIPESVDFIDIFAFTGCENLTIYCYSGTAAETFAKENGFAYTLLTPTPKAVTGFTLGGRAADALRLNWTKNTSADGYIIEQYKSAKWVRIAKIANNATVTYRVTGLSAGTAYKFRMKAYKMDGSTALYSDYTATLSACTNPSTVNGLKLGGRASNALRLNWNKNTSANGYIIEQYKSGKWVRIAKIASNATTTYRVSGLAAGTAYKFRMKAYKMSGSTAIYSAYTSTFAARTNPSNVTGVKIGGKASTALRLNWTKNTSADGYIVEIYKGGKWVRAAKITKNTTLTYRISGLAKNTTYKIRIKAYKMSGSTALYSGYTTISGKTTA